MFLLRRPKRTMRLLSEVVAGRFRQFNPLISCRPVSSPGRLKKGAFDETLSREPVSGPKPQPNRPVLLSHKTVYHTPIYGSQKEDGSTQPGPSWQGGRNDKVKVTRRDHVKVTHPGFKVALPSS